MSLNQDIAIENFDRYEETLYDDQGRYVGVTRRDYKPADPKDLVGPDYNPFLEDEK